MVTTKEHTIFVEKYRPKTLDNYICDEQIREKIQEFITNQDIPHLGFFGLQGSGKSTLAKILVNSIDCDFIYLNATENRGMDDIKEKVGSFASARGFKPNGLRYITIMFEERPKVFGLDKVDFTKTYFITEGALDSMFLSNAVAMAGADGNVSGLKQPENSIFVFDSEPRNKEIHKRMEKIIRSGYKICIWPSNLPGKDINEMILNGVQDIEKLILKNTYKGLEANLKLMSWRKV
jgi:DNA polymerase III delta prime subunit